MGVISGGNGQGTRWRHAQNPGSNRFYFSLYLTLPECRGQPPMYVCLACLPKQTPGFLPTLKMCVSSTNQYYYLGRFNDLLTSFDKFEQDDRDNCF